MDLYHFWNFSFSKFFFRGRNPKNDQDRPKKPSFLTKKWKSSYTKTLLTKNVPNDTSPCSKFFFRGRNPKNDRDRPKKPSFLTKKWNSSYTKTLLTKNVPNDTSPCSKFFSR